MVEFYNDSIMQHKPHHSLSYMSFWLVSATEEEVLVFNPYMIPSSLENLCKPSDGMHELLFAIENSKLIIKEVRNRSLLIISVLLI